MDRHMERRVFLTTALGAAGVASAHPLQLAQDLGPDLNPRFPFDQEIQLAPFTLRVIKPENGFAIAVKCGEESADAALISVFYRQRLIVHPAPACSSPATFDVLLSKTVLAPLYVEKAFGLSECFTLPVPWSAVERIRIKAVREVARRTIR